MLAHNLAYSVTQLHCVRQVGPTLLDAVEILQEKLGSVLGDVVEAVLSDHGCQELEFARRHQILSVFVLLQIDQQLL